MAYKALYRTYRPTKFEEVAGQHRFGVSCQAHVLDGHAVDDRVKRVVDVDRQVGGVLIG